MSDNQSDHLFWLNDVALKISGHKKLILIPVSSFVSVTLRVSDSDAAESVSNGLSLDRLITSARNKMHARTVNTNEGERERDRESERGVVVGVQHPFVSSRLGGPSSSNQNQRSAR